MVKEQGWLKAAITNYVRHLDWDDPSITSAPFLRRLPDINAKIAAFAIQNEQPQIADLLGIENDNSLQSALKKLRKAIRKEIESDGGGLVAYQQQMSTAKYETMAEVFLRGRVELINDGMEIIVKGDSCFTLPYYFPLHHGNDLYVQASRAFGAGKVTLKSSSDEYQDLVNEMTHRKTTVNIMRRRKEEWTQTLQQGNENESLILVPISEMLRDGVSVEDYEVEALWEYIVCMLRHKQMEEAAALDAFYKSPYWQPQLHDLEAHEGYWEREAREYYLGLPNDEESYSDQRTRNSHWVKRSGIMRKYKAEREQTLLNKAERLLDPENVAVKMLKKQCEISIHKLSEDKKRSKRRRQKRKERKAKSVEEKFCGGRFTLSELRDAAKATLEKKTFVRW